MIRTMTKHTATSTLFGATVRSVTLPATVCVALLLGACGGGGTTDPAAAPEAPATEAAVEAVTDAASDVAADAADAGESAVAAGDDVADELGDGWTAMQDDWATSAGVVKDRWSELTEEEILGTAGDRDQLVGLVQEKYGLEREQAEAEVSDWAATL